jgi:hypothetical protein
MLACRTEGEPRERRELEGFGTRDVHVELQLHELEAAEGGVGAQVAFVVVDFRGTGGPTPLRAQRSRTFAGRC